MAQALLDEIVLQVCTYNSGRRFCSRLVENLRPWNFSTALKLQYSCLIVLSHDGVTIGGGFGLIIVFIGLFDIVRDYNLLFTVSHTHTHTVVSIVMSSLPVAW
jgi:hypothetical protein